MWHRKHLGVILGSVLMLTIAITGMREFNVREVLAMPDNPNPTTAPGALSKSEIEQRALELAPIVGLQGPHTKITSKQMTLDEARRRMGAEVYEPRDPNTVVWYVVIRGPVRIEGPLRRSAQGEAQPPEYDNLYLMLNTAGRVGAMGAKPDGQSPAVDLDAPVPGGPAPYWSNPRITPPEEMPRPGAGHGVPEPKPAAPGPKRTPTRP